MFLNSLVKVSARVVDIASIAQATLKMIHSALLIYKGWLVFHHFYFILDLPTCVHRADIHLDLPTEVSKLSAHCVCRFLTFEWQHDSDWGFLLLRYLLLGVRILRHFRINELTDGRLHKFVWVAQSGKVAVRRQLGDLSRKIKVDISPV